MRLLTNSKMFLDENQIEELHKNANGLVCIDLDAPTQKMKLLWDNLVNFMDDEKREKVHNKLADCTAVEFLKEYCKFDFDFEVDILNYEYHLYLVD